MTVSRVYCDAGELLFPNLICHNMYYFVLHNFCSTGIGRRVQDNFISRIRLKYETIPYTTIPEVNNVPQDGLVIRAQSCFNG